MVNGIGVACLDREAPVGEEAMAYVTQAISYTNYHTRQFGVEIVSAGDWQDAQHEAHEFLAIATEIGCVLKLAFGFSTQRELEQLNPNESFVRPAKDESVLGVTYSALVY